MTALDPGLPVRPHGMGGYKRGCRCFTCRRAQAAYMRRYRSGQRTRIDSAETIRHIERLLDSGMRLGSIAKAAGIPAQTLQQLMGKRRPTVWPRTAEAVLAVTLDSLPPHTIVSKAPALRLLGGMERAGVDMAAVNALIGWSDRRRWPGMRETTLRRVVHLYRYLARQGIVEAALLDEVAG